MKIKGIVILCLISNVMLLAQGKEPIVVSPLIGEKLDRIERNYFKLFPHFDGFEEAVFYLNPDRSLMVEIWYQTDDGIKDTVLQKYRSLSNLRDQIDLIVYSSINDIEDSKKGSFATIITKDSSFINGELFQIKASSLQVYNPDHKILLKDGLGAYGFKNIDYSNINEINLIDSTNIASYIYPILGGLIGGLIANSILGSGSPPPSTGNFISDLQQGAEQGIAEGFAKGAGIAFGALLGTAAGYMLSYVLPIITAYGTTFQSPFEENDIEGLRDNARHSEEIPYYLTNEK